MTVTQKQIGERLGLTQQAVALALKGSTRVPESTRNRVIETAKEMGYTKYSNRHARMLINQRHGKRVPTGIMAVTLEPAYPGAPVTGIPYFRAPLNGIEIEAGRREVQILLAPSPTGHLPIKLPLLIAEGWVDGVICLSTELHELDKLGLPIVMVGGSFPTVDSLMPDDDSGIKQVMNHLIGLGHRKFAYMGAKEHSSALQRLATFRNVLRERGLEVDEFLIEQTKTWEYMEAHGEGLLNLLARDQMRQKACGAPPNRLPSFTAVVCYNDLMAIDTVRKAQELGIRVPEDLSVVGFDDVSNQYNFHPAITSIRIPLLQMGRRSVEIIWEKAGYQEDIPTGDSPKEHSPLQHEVFPVELVTRESSGHAPPRARWTS
jgi:LacI family transcriptional regulator